MKWAAGKPDGILTNNQRFPDTRDFQYGGIAMPGAGGGAGPARQMTGKASRINPKRQK